MKSLVIEPLLLLSEAEALATPGDLIDACTLSSQNRRREFLSWRAIVRRELGSGVDIAYDPLGAPIITNRDIYIGVSHGAGHVAVCISDEPCAVDIESPNRNFARVASRYLTDRERALSDDPLLPAVVWCAKEALYKFARREGLDFLRDLHLERIDFGAEELTGRIPDHGPIPLRMRSEASFVAVYIL